ncbi:MAG TPA: lipid-binding SYLF domain-containing protein [Terriglobales bacterium]|nr:lipid-binding SYLF domain-containing protein [Terriglobales bacterium]
MKGIGSVLALLLLTGCIVWAQDNSANSNANNGNDNAVQSQSTATTTSTTTNSNNSTDSAQADQDQGTRPTVTEQKHATDQSRKDAAVSDENAADAKKDQAKNATSKEGAERDKSLARLDDAAKDIDQLLAAPDNGIPDEVFTKAKCVAVIPSMIKGGFIFGAEHGRGVASCRLANGSWSAPAFFTMTGGSWGAQIGAEGVDLVMLIMNQNGMNQLLSSKFKLGASASASAGPVGRQAAADTSWKMNSEILTYSRSRGLFAGATLNGASIKEDEDAMRGYYGRTEGFRPVLTGHMKDPHGNDRFTASLHKNRQEVNAQAH